MFRIFYDDYTIFLGEETGKWVCFKDYFRKPMNSTKKEENTDALLIEYPGEIRTVLENKLKSIDVVEEESPRKFKLLIIVTSNTCNMNCDYCYMSSKKRTSVNEKITSKKIIEIIDSFSNVCENNSFQVLFQGGEPMLDFEEIKKAISYYKEKGEKYIFCIQSNGTLFSEKNLEFIKENDVHIGISRDGQSNEDNRDRDNKKRYHKSTYKDILDQAESDMKKKGILYGVVSVINANNLKNIVDNANALFNRKVYNFSFNPIFPIGRGKDVSLDDEYLHDYIEAMKDLFRHIYKKNFEEGFLSFEKYSENNLLILWEKIYKRRFSQSCCNKSPCGAGNETYTVDWRGDVYPCTYFLPNVEEGHKLGNIEDLERIMKMDVKYVSKIWNLNMIDKCKNCPYKRICGGGGCTGAVYQTSGQKKESVYCEYYKEIIPFIIVNSMKIMGKNLSTNY